MSNQGGWERKSLLKAVCKKYKRGGIVMRKLVRIGVALVIIIGTVSGIASAKTLYVVAEDTISNDTQTAADVFAVSVKVLTYNNQCMTLTFSSAAAVNGVSPGNTGFLPEIDGSQLCQHKTVTVRSTGPQVNLTIGTWQDSRGTSAGLILENIQSRYGITPHIRAILRTLARGFSRSISKQGR